jgi:hypothetical protein
LPACAKWLLIHANRAVRLPIRGAKSAVPSVKAISGFTCLRAACAASVAVHAETATTSNEAVAAVRHEIDGGRRWRDDTLCAGNVLNKVRRFVIHKDDTWEVNVYDDILKGIVLAEIELTQPDQDLQIPDWVGAEVYRRSKVRKDKHARGTAAGRRSL